MPGLPSYEEYAKAHAEKQAKTAAELEAAGVMKVGNRYFQKPDPIQQAQAGQNLTQDFQQFPVDLANKELDTKLKEKQLAKVEQDAKPKLSTAERTSLTSGDTALAKITKIRGLLKSNKTDTGSSTVIRGLIRKLTGNRLGENTESIDLRATLADLGSEYAKMLSGAAVSDKEFENRLKPFLPQATDTKKEIEVKLKNLEQAIQIKQNSITQRSQQTNVTDLTPEQIQEADSFLNGIQ